MLRLKHTPSLSSPQAEVADTLLENHAPTLFSTQPHLTARLFAPLSGIPPDLNTIHFLLSLSARKAYSSPLPLLHSGR
jgi:hypothetical protein